eukprot:gene15465-17308_t
MITMATDCVLPGPPDPIEDRAFKSYIQETIQIQKPVLSIQAQKPPPPPPTITFVLQAQNISTNVKLIEKSSTTDNDDESIQSQSSSKLPLEMLKGFQSLQLLPSDDPREVVVEGSFTIHLDDCNRIEKFLLQACQVSTNNVSHFK